MADQINARDEAPPPVPEEEYAAVCADVIDLGKHWNEKYKREEHKCALVFQLDALNDKKQRYQVAQRFTVSMNEKARLRAFLTQWRGRSYSDEESKKGVPLHLLEGQPAVIVIEHQKGATGKLYANILTIRRPDRNATPLTVKDYTRSEFWKKAVQANAAKNGNGRDEPTDDDYQNAGHDEEDDSDIPF